MVTATVSSKGWIVIPAKERRAFGIVPGTQVAIRRDGNTLRLTPINRNPIDAAQGMLKGGNPLSNDLAAERAREMKREEERLLAWR